MDEYISKHEAYKMMKDLEAAYIYPPVKEAYGTAARRIDQIPAADVQPIKHGRWVQIGEQNAKCTACGGVLRSNGIDKTGKALIFNAVYHYCPFCGARMDGDKND